MWGPTILIFFSFIYYNISIHGPRVGADSFGGYSYTKASGFQSTAPVWGPTGEGAQAHDWTHISIHGPRVGADVGLVANIWYKTHFNPRPPCGGRRLRTCGAAGAAGYFNPRPPCGGRRSPFLRAVPDEEFQSTAPVWGPTDINGGISWTLSNFNPRPPCGGRLHRFYL